MPRNMSGDGGGRPFVDFRDKLRTVQQQAAVAAAASWSSLSDSATSPSSYMQTLLSPSTHPPVGRFASNVDEKQLNASKCGSNLLSKWQEAWKEISAGNESNYEAARMVERLVIGINGTVKRRQDALNQLNHGLVQLPVLHDHVHKLAANIGSLCGDFEMVEAGLFELENTGEVLELQSQMDLQSSVLPAFLPKTQSLRTKIMNLKFLFLAGVLLCFVLEGIDAKRKGKSGKGRVSKGKSGGPRLRSSRMSRGSVQGLIDNADPILLRCQFLERNFGEGAGGVQIRKCKVKRPYKKKVDLTCEFGDFLCNRCEIAKCHSYQKNKKVFLFHLAKKILAGIKQDPYTKELYCSGKPINYAEESCRVEFPFSSNFVAHKPKPKTTVARTTTAATTTTATTTITSSAPTTESSHPNCDNDPNQLFCNTFMSWGDLLFNKPFENR